MAGEDNIWIGLVGPDGQGFGEDNRLWMPPGEIVRGIEILIEMLGSHNLKSLFDNGYRIEIRK